MDKIIWDNKFSLGNNLVDEQHKKLFEILDRCVRLEDRSTAKYLVLVRELLDYCQVHFATEEQFMAENNYPYIEAHKVEHSKVLAAVEKIVIKLYNCEKVDIDAVNNFVHNWVVKHIMNTDMKIKNYIR